MFLVYHEEGEKINLKSIAACALRSYGVAVAVVSAGVDEGIGVA